MRQSRIKVKLNCIENNMEYDILETANTICLSTSEGDGRLDSAMKELPFLENKERKDKVYYVCNSETCLAPTSDISFLLD